MRSFQIIYILIFLVVFFGSALGGLKNFLAVFGRDSIVLKRWIRLTYFVVILFLVAGFVFLYIYPKQPRHIDSYTLHIYFNVIFFIIFFFNLITTLSLFAHILIESKKSIVIPYMGFIIALSVSLSMIYGTITGSRSVTVKNIDLHFTNLPIAFENFRIVQISDYHLGNILNSNKFIERVNAKISNIDFDMLLFTGDLVNNFSHELRGMSGIFKSITKNRLSYSILGNHDYGDYTDWESDNSKQENFAGIVAGYDDLGLKLLRNENVVIRSGSDSVFLVGVENWGHPPFPQYADLEKALTGVPDDAFTILMTHDPAHWESNVNGKENIDLTLSGHSHGLQWGIKPAGITFSMSYLTRRYWGGLYGSDDSYLYVNTGLGTVGIPWRIDMPAEITVITLKRGQAD
jgi:uncharacterized protein